MSGQAGDPGMRYKGILRKLDCRSTSTDLNRRFALVAGELLGLRKGQKTGSRPKLSRWTRDFLGISWVYEGSGSNLYFEFFPGLVGSKVMGGGINLL